MASTALENLRSYLSLSDSRCASEASLSEIGNVDFQTLQPVYDIDVTPEPLPQKDICSLAYVYGPQEIYVQRAQEADRAFRMRSQLSRLYDDRTPAVPMHQLRPGLYCIAKYPSDGMWYRARILILCDRTSASVHYIDYGNRGAVPFESLKPMIPAFAKIAPLARRVRIHPDDIRMTSSMEDPDVLHRFNTYLIKQCPDRVLIYIEEPGLYTAHSDDMAPIVKLLNVDTLENYVEIVCPLVDQVANKPKTLSRESVLQKWKVKMEEARQKAQERDNYEAQFGPKYIDDTEAVIHGEFFYDSDYEEDQKRKKKQGKEKSLKTRKKEQSDVDRQRQDESMRQRQGRTAARSFGRGAAALAARRRLEAGDPTENEPRVVYRYITGCMKTPPANAKRPVKITEIISPVEFYVQIPPVQHAHKKMQEKMAKLYSNETPPLDFNVLKKESGCVVWMPGDQKFMRARVIDPMEYSDAITQELKDDLPGVIYLVLVDTGKRVVLSRDSPSDMVRIKPLFDKVAAPPCSHRCALTRLPAHDEYTQDHTDRLRVLLDKYKSRLTVEFVDHVRLFERINTWRVKLYDADKPAEESGIIKEYLRVQPREDLNRRHHVLSDEPPTPLALHPEVHAASTIEDSRSSVYRSVAGSVHAPDDEEYDLADEVDSDVELDEAATFQARMKERIAGNVPTLKPRVETAPEAGTHDKVEAWLMTGEIENQVDETRSIAVRQAPSLAPTQEYDNQLPSAGTQSGTRPLMVQIVHADSPAEFYVQTIEQEQMAHIVATRMMNDYGTQNQGAGIDWSQLEMGTPVAAQYIDELKGPTGWYRAVVQALEPSRPGMCTIRYVDYGNSVTVHAGALRPLSVTYRFSPLCYKCVLQGFDPPTPKYDPTLYATTFTQYLLSHTDPTSDSCRFMVQFLGQVSSNNGHVVSLYNPKDNNDVVNTILKRDADKPGTSQGNAGASTCLKTAPPPMYGMPLPPGPPPMPFMPGPPPQFIHHMPPPTYATPIYQNQQVVQQQSKARQQGPPNDQYRYPRRH